MNKRVILLLTAFAAGAGVGFLVTRKLLEDEYARIAQEEIDNVKEFYGRTSAERLAKQVEKAQEKSKNSDNTPAHGALTRNSMDEGASAYGKSRVAYHDIAKENLMKRWNEQSQSAHLMSDDEEVEEYEPETDAAGYSEGDMDNDHHDRDLSDIDRSLPYIIDDHEYSEEFEHHDKLSLYYYSEDDTLCDENEEIIDDIDGTVGWECFEKMRMQTTVWVRNEPLSTDYEVISIRGKYSEAILGAHIPYSDAGLTPREKYMKNQKRRLEGFEE